MQTEDLVFDVLELKYKDMKYHRELLLPDLLHEPVASLPEAELSELSEPPVPEPEPAPEVSSIMSYNVMI